MSAELAARRVAARAALNDYRSQQDDEDVIGLAAWSARLAGLLGGLLDELDDEDTEEHS
ncbi:MAG: hypothetical protein ACRDNS_14070 [Trebonia sp.]